MLFLVSESLVFALC